MLKKETKVNELNLDHPLLDLLVTIDSRYQEDLNLKLALIRLNAQS